MDKDTALRKIQKCLALSKSSEPHEAARAMQQAQALMRQFDIDHPELLAAGVSEDWTKSRAKKTPPSYEVWLANVVAKAFACNLMFSRKWSGRDIEGGYVFIGVGASAEVAAYSFSVLNRKLIKARAEYTTKFLQRYKRNKVAAADLFCDGWVYGVSQAVLPNPPDEERQAAIDAYRRLHGMDTGRQVKTTSRELADTGAAGRHSLNGESAGKKEQLNAGLASKPAKQLALV